MKMTMTMCQRVMALILLGLMMMTVVSCGEGGYGHNAYNFLADAEQICNLLADSIHEGCYYTLANDSLFRDWMFANATGCPEDEIEKAVSQIGVPSSPVEAIHLVLCVYENTGVISKLDRALLEAKQELEMLISEQPENKEYPKLKEYYGKLVSYSEFLKSAHYSFDDFVVAVQVSEKEIRDCRAELDLDFG